MSIGSGKRGEWVFTYRCSVLAQGARAQKKFRLGRVKFWTKAKAKVMAMVKRTGIEVSESMGAGISNYTSHKTPQVMVRADLQTKLSECHQKIQDHQQAADEYDGWIQVLEANRHAGKELTQADWLYFFGKQ